MKILEIHDYIAPGNSRYSFEKCKALMRAGNEVHMLAGVGSLGPLNGDVVEGIKYHTYEYTRDLNVFSTNRRFIKKLQKEYSFDVFFFNQPLCCFSTITTLEGWHATRAYFFHSPWMEEFRIASNKNGASQIGMIARNLVEGIAVSKCDIAFTNSQYMQSKFKKLHPGIRPPIVVWGGVNTDHFYPRDKSTSRKKLNIPVERKVIFTVRRLVRRMGISDLIEAVCMIQDQFPELLLIVGGDGPLKNELVSLVDKLNLKSQVDFTGYITDDELPFYFSAADLVVMPTRELEGLGLVALEAMACGTPVAGTPVGGLEEVIGDFDKRFLFSNVGGVAIAKGLSLILKNLDVSAEKLREWVKEKYNWDKIANRMNEVLLRR